MDEIYSKLKKYNDVSKLDVDGSFYKNQQTLVGMFLDEFCLHGKSEKHLIKLRWPIRKLCGYYVCDTPIVDQLIKRGYSVKYVPSWNHIFVKIKFKDLRLRKNVLAGKYDWFTDECVKYFNTEDDFHWLSNYARPGYSLDQLDESCNL